MRQNKYTLVRLACLVLLCLISLGVFPVRAAGDGSDAARVFDQAGLFTASQVQELERQIQEIREEMKMDLVLVTAEDALGMSSEGYADWYYENGGFGEGNDYRGALLLMDMDNRMLYVSTEGAMIRFLTDDRIEEMMDHAVAGMQQGDYAAAAKAMISDVREYYKKGIPGGQYQYDRETGTVSRHRSIRWYEALLALAVAAVTGGGACLSVKKQYAMEQERDQASSYHMAYRADARLNLRNQSEALLHQHVSHCVIPRATGESRGGGRSGGVGGGSRSTTHTSRGGRTHGGGGRGF